ncbi:NAD-dependent epimerase/dehydratase family protein [Nocardiopsis sp. CT-R113]|uniref:NAD-dependent epimerase/dehydratase family protein n=1 Tax=Nocardiopsis codii TaxID=3065942 RepID=A0ABU7KBU2_9ACTN|nr:NAD-dependent epimerase/dehydratase family protein [Nocardiopsis sp. CT-R113]MEE2039389.1 NAD-dependent epimerase/dehydratase family protein [Nocardiopsis sp. CT-R113]
MARVVLVTGVSSPLAARVAQTLSEQPGVRRVIGADSSPPPRHSQGIEYAHVDLHDGSLDRIVTDSGADLVLHLGLDTEGAPNREDNLLGTMRVLGAAQRSTTVRRLVVRSSATLDADDAAEVERHTRGLQRRRPDLSVALLRFANLIGPSADTPLTRYLDSRVVPTVLGSDPRVRFLHEDDGAEALVRMALSDGTGFFDVAGTDPVPLSQCLRRVGGQRLPVPARGLKVLSGLAKHGRIGYASSSTTRAVHAGLRTPGMDPDSLERVLDWSPAYSSAEAFESYAHSRTVSPPRGGRGLRPIHVLALARATLGR